MLVTVGEGRTVSAEQTPWGQLTRQNEIFRWQGAWMIENRPWFQVHVEEYLEEGVAEHIVLAPPMPEFETLFPSLCSGMEVTAVMLVSPPWLNRSAYWRMDPIRTMSCVESFDRKRDKGILYELEGCTTPLLDAPFSLKDQFTEDYAIYSTERPATGTNWLNVPLGRD